ncbi:MAG: transcription-repair coupling factor [Alphaproteobacteria bacterium]|nr:transcription-repair coupling factor [Alphaproteobacteria bacterium]
MDPRPLFAAPGRTVVGGVLEGQDALVLAGFARSGAVGDILHVASDEVRLARLTEALAFFAPDLEVLEFPPWDTAPYDRSSPNADVMSRRVDTLTRLANSKPPPRGQGRIIATTVGALIQRVPRREAFSGVGLSVKVGGRLDLKVLGTFLERNGYNRTEQVMEPSEYAIRGGIVDLFPPGTPEPLRLDLFGDEVEAIRTFDPVSQRTTGKIESHSLRPTSEIFLDADSIARFRSRYRELFGTAGGADPLYEAVSAGRRFTGLEHWLPLFHAGMDTLFAYAPEAAVTLDHRVDEAREARLDLIMEYYDARASLSPKGAGQGFTEGGVVYNPVPPHHLFLAPEEWDRLFALRPVVQFSPFAAADPAGDVTDADGRPGRDFADVRAHPDRNVFDALREHLADLRREGKRVAVAGFTAGSRDRLASVMREHRIAPLETVETWAEAVDLPPETVAVLPFGLERGFSTPVLALIGEQDILGERLARSTRTKRRLSDKFIADISALVEGDRVVHVDHGIGQYDGLAAIAVGGAPHDCLRILYDGGDKLFVPVENIDVLSRYGSEQDGVALDKLGGVAWQSRKAKLKKRIADMATRLIEVAAARKVRTADVLAPPEGLFDEFCARFPYAETDDQLRAIGEVIEDMGSGRPMDRLICGDVGFGKTEVALRAAFVAALSGAQVAVVVPTTLLARQHHRTFAARFAGLPVRVEQLSRLLTAKQAAAVKKGLDEGTVDIVIGTHALLAKSVSIRRLGLLIVDEEQHFGVAHKERLKQIRADVHVLTLTATPIPRTLQMALTGVREMSVITTPPADRLAVRTSVLPYDPVVVREALLRERFRGGQSFYVCPRIEDIDSVVERVRKLVPDLRVAVAHGRMASSELEEVITAFTERTHDVLVCTNIIESGLDMPSVNTIVIHRADMFGLSQLYQLRGRVGRGKARSYAYLTVKPDRPLTKTAEKRLTVMQTLDTLGAGFTLASHDLDIRGAGNLLGDEQSGHIREVGVELYQHLLEEAVAAAREGGTGTAEAVDEWSPQITLGTSVMIPEGYVKDLGVRLSLYRRIAGIGHREEIDELAVEMVDRFGALPKEVDNLLEIVELKILCRRAGVERLDAGPKGAVIGFRHNRFANPAGLVAFIGQQAGTVKVRPDHKLVIIRNWEGPVTRVQGVREVMTALATLAAEGE